MSDVTQKAVRSFMLHNPMVDQTLAQRFVVNNGGCFEKALVQYKKFEEKFQTCDATKVTFQDVQDELKTGKMLPVVGAYDKSDSPYIYIDIGKHDPALYKPQRTIKLFHFAITSLLNTPEMQEKGLTLVINFNNVEKKNIENDSFVKIVQFFQDSYPCCLTNIFLLRMPWWVGFNDKVTGCLHEETKKKIKKIDRFSEAVAPSQIPAFIGGGFAFDLPQYVQMYTPPPSEDPTASISTNEVIKNFESASFDAIFGVISPQTVAPPTSGTESSTESSAEEALESLRKQPYCGFDTKHVNKRMRELDQEIEEYRKTHNTLDAAPEKLGLSASDYYSWVESEWMNAVKKYDNLCGRRFSSTTFYEGSAFEALVALKSKKNRSFSMAIATCVTPDPTTDTGDLPQV